MISTQNSRRFSFISCFCFVLAISINSQSIQVGKDSTTYNVVMCPTGVYGNGPTRSNDLCDLDDTKMAQLTSRTPNQTTIYNIPTVVHILYRSNNCTVPIFGTIGNNSGNHLTDEKIFESIGKLNKDLRNYSGNSEDLKIQFVLAARDENGNCTNGINRVNLSSNSTFSSHGIGYNSTDNGLSPAYLQTNYGWNDQKYYNIYVSPELNIDGSNAEQNCVFSDITTLAPRGFASFPCSSGGSKGCYILSSSFAPNSRDRVFTHEIGHSLGLLHTFEGSSQACNNNPTSSLCTCPSDNNCNTQGDYCCDIAAHKPYNGNSPGWSILDCDASLISNSNSCSSLSNNTWKYNFMNYGGINCRDRFSNDQKTRARNAVELYYDDLLQSNGCLSLTPPSNVNIDFSSSETSVKVTEKIKFLNNSCGIPNSGLDDEYQIENITYLWTISDQSNSNLPMKSRKKNPTFTFYNAGTYNVKLDVISDGVTYTENKSAYISVSDHSSSSNNTFANGSNGPNQTMATFGQSSQTFDCALDMGKVWFKIDQIEKISNCDPSSNYLGFNESELDYVSLVCAARYPISGNSWDWKHTDHYGPFDDNKGSFSHDANYIFHHETLSSNDYTLFSVTGATWEDDDAIPEIWATCSSFVGIPTPCDECIDTWKTSNWKWIDKLAGKYNFPGDWFLFDTLKGNDYELIIKTNFLWSTSQGTSVWNAINFGNVDQYGCPDEIVYNANYNRMTSNGNNARYMYYKFTTSHRRRLIIDLSYQNGFSDFSLLNWGSSTMTPYFATSNLPKEYLDSESYIKKYDLNPGTYYIKIDAPVQGKHILKINSDNSPPNNKWIWTGAYQPDWGSPVYEDHWTNTLNWDPCILPDENSNVEIPFIQGEYQPKIYAGETGKCKTIRIDSDNGAKLGIEATGKLKVEN